MIRRAMTGMNAGLLVALLLSPQLVWGQEEPPVDEPAEDAPTTEPGELDQPVLVEPGPAAAPESTPAQDAYFREIVGRSGGLTADQAAEEAAAYTKAADVAQEDLKSAKAHVSKTIFNYAPQVTLTASYTRQSVPPTENAFGDSSLVGVVGDPNADPLFAIPGDAFSFPFLRNNYFLNLGVVIPISDYILNMSQALAGANAAKKSAKLNEKAARVNAAANARLAYYDWVRAKLAQGEAQKSHERAKEQHKLLQDMFQAGRVARADVLRQDAFLSQSELNVRRASTQEIIARENLHVMMTGGKGNAPEWSIGENVMEERTGDSVTTGSIDRLHQEAIQNRLEIQALDSTDYALRQQVSVQKTHAYPRVEGFGNVTYANPNQRFFPQEDEWNGSWDVGIRAIWTLNNIGSASADAKVSKAEVAKVRAQKAQLRDALRTEVLSAHRNLEEASLARESARRGVTAAQASYDDRKQLFENGRATAFDVLDAETALVNARLNLVQAYVQLRMARVRYDHALGRDVDDVVKAPKRRD